MMKVTVKTLFTWNGSDKEIRQYFVENGLVEAVIALPPRMLMSTNVQTSLIVLSRGNKEIRMVDATELYEPGRRYIYAENSEH